MCLRQQRENAYINTNTYLRHCIDFQSVQTERGLDDLRARKGCVTM